MLFKVQNGGMRSGSARRDSLTLRTAFKLALPKRGPADADGPDDLSAGLRHGQPLGGGTLPVIQPSMMPPGPSPVLIDSTGLQVYGQFNG
jgi:hypothetical protein